MILVAVCFAACTHNNGDIGPLFGQWAMTTITCDGAPVDGISADDYTWRFQNDIVMISLADRTAHTTLNYTATWELNGKALEIDFRQKSDVHPNGVPVPEVLGFTQRNTAYTLNVDAMTSSRMSLTLHSPDGHVCSYTLEKIN